MIRLLIDGDGSFFINNIERVAAERLPRRLADIYETRGEKVLFLEAEDSISYQAVVAAIDTAQSAAPGLKVMLITPSTRESCDRGGILRRITREDRQPASNAL
jgi:biopolymer transport protein ExbD